MLNKPTKPTPIKARPVGYSYIRFSTTEQRKGDSLRRQTEAAKAWCERNGVHLDTSLTLRDLGVSAYKGKHRRDDKHALAQFLSAVKEGKIARGSYLIIENLDRLSREDARTALTLWLSILDSGVNIVQLSPETVFRHEKTEMFDVMRAIMELSRGHGESEIKSVRLSAVWEAKRSYVREKGEVMTRNKPCWLDLRDGKWIANPQKTLAIQRIFQLAGEGKGSAKIVRQLEAERVPPIHGTAKRPGRWLASRVRQLLNDRRVLGEFQMRHDGKPAGEVVKGYYPRLILDEAVWLRARASAGSRRVKGKKGRGAYDKEGFINLFSRLLKDARHDGSALNVVRALPAHGRGKDRRVIRNMSLTGRGSITSFPYDTFERGILTVLDEVKLIDVIEDAEEPDERLRVAAELDNVVSRIIKIKDNLLSGGDIDALADVLRQLEAKRHELGERLETAKQRELMPLTEAWKETKSLLAARDKAKDKDDYNRRLRAVIHREIESIWVAIGSCGSTRLAEVTIVFAGGKAWRNCTIYHRPPSGNNKVRHPGKWAVVTAKHPDHTRLGLPGADHNLSREEDRELIIKALDWTTPQCVSTVLDELSLSQPLPD
jgi:DNA invertase Pin-like site-specific DNA recombinase